MYTNIGIRTRIIIIYCDSVVRFYTQQYYILMCKPTTQYESILQQF